MRVFNAKSRRICFQVFYEEDIDDPEENSILRAITCILQIETDPVELLNDLPKNLESLTLIAGVNSGNKTLNFTNLRQFENLLILELKGTHAMGDKNYFFCNVDVALESLKYLNLDEVVTIKNSKHHVKLSSGVKESTATFEYKQQFKSDSHPLTMVQNADEILPYTKYREQREGSNGVPLFVGFKNLVLLRINKCELNNVAWEMFDGLNNLEYLLLDDNNLMFVPDFAFYGIPNLKMISLAKNNLLNIQVTDLAGLLELEYLDLSYNNFSQLSELSFPPFPKLKLANFGNNPINVVFPSTFEVMNTTDSIILGGKETPLTLLENSFLGLKMLLKITLKNLIVPVLKRELITGMPSLKELVISGNVTKIEYDTFLDSPKLTILILANCNIQTVSMDAFIGLQKLEILDLSHNQFRYLPTGTFDELISLNELYLNSNHFTYLERDMFRKIQPKMIRLNHNPWHCSCKMSDWKSMVVNKVKQKTVRACSFREDKGIKCDLEDLVSTKYVFDNRVAPKCATPRKFLNWSVFHAMRKQLRCPEYKGKLKKVKANSAKDNSLHRPEKFSLLIDNGVQEINNDLNQLHVPVSIVSKGLLQHRRIKVAKLNNYHPQWQTKHHPYKKHEFKL